MQFCMRRASLGTAGGLDTVWQGTLTAGLGPDNVSDLFSEGFVVTMVGQNPRHTELC
jgi:hypothetical protein